MGADGPRMTPQTLAVLRVMLDEPDASYYGLELAKAIELRSGTIYPILARLERYDWVRSEPEDVDPKAEGRPPRRMYRLTGLGEEAAKRAIDELRTQLEPRAGRPGWGLRPRGQTT